VKFIIFRAGVRFGYALKVPDRKRGAMTGMVGIAIVPYLHIKHLCFCVSMGTVLLTRNRLC